MVNEGKAKLPWQKGKQGCLGKRNSKASLPKGKAKLPCQKEKQNSLAKRESKTSLPKGEAKLPWQKEQQSPLDKRKNACCSSHLTKVIPCTVSLPKGQLQLAVATWQKGSNSSAVSLQKKNQLSAATLDKRHCFHGCLQAGNLVKRNVQS